MEFQWQDPMYLQLPAGANHQCCDHGVICNNNPFPWVNQPQPISCNCHNLGMSNLSLDLYIKGTNCGVCQQVNGKTPLGDLVDTMEHGCHRGCTLKLAFYPAYTKNEFTCVGCGGDIKDSSVYGCLTCSLKLHVKCAFLPETLSNEEHEGPMTLYYSVGSACGKEKSLICGICGQTTPPNLWVYYCQKCGYGADVSCILAKEHLKEDLQSYKDAFKPYESRPGSTGSCTRKC